MRGDGIGKDSASAAQNFKMPADQGHAKAGRLCEALGRRRV
jgi:hypothetical protein